MTAPRADETWLRTELVASWGEMGLVLLFTVGYAAYESAWSAFHGSSSYYPNFFRSDFWMFANMVWQIATLTLLLGFLCWRGWTTADFKIKANGWSSLQGIFLWLASKVGASLGLLSMMVLMALMFKGFLDSHGFFGWAHLKLHGNPSWIVVIGSSIVNAYWEELTCMGYAFNQFAARRGPLFALLLTVVLRMSYHTYQGFIHMSAAGLGFLITGVYYWRTRNLWPLILAHILFNSVPLDLLHDVFYILRVCLGFFR